MNANLDKSSTNENDYVNRDVKKDDAKPIDGLQDSDHSYKYNIDKQNAIDLKVGEKIQVGHNIDKPYEDQGKKNINM